MSNRMERKPVNYAECTQPSCVWYTAGTDDWAVLERAQAHEYATGHVCEFFSGRRKSE